jgi:hypothetical protein
VDTSRAGPNFGAWDCAAESPDFGAKEYSSYYLRPDGKVGHDAFAVIRETIAS